MAILRITRFTIDPADTEEMLARRAALIDAVNDAYPGLTETRLAKVDDKTWLDVWRWESPAQAQAALNGAPQIPQAGAAFSLTTGATAEFAEVVDER